MLNPKPLTEWSRIQYEMQTEDGTQRTASAHFEFHRCAFKQKVHRGHLVSAVGEMYVSRLRRAMLTSLLHVVLDAGYHMDTQDIELSVFQDPDDHMFNSYTFLVTVVAFRKVDEDAYRHWQNWQRLGIAATSAKAGEQVEIMGQAHPYPLIIDDPVRDRGLRAYPWETHTTKAIEQ